MRIAAFTKYAERAASTRQRVLQYRPCLEAAGIQLEHFPLLPDEYVDALTTKRAYPKWKLGSRYFSRMLELRATSADVLWIYAELFPFLPGLFERIATSTGKPIVYDFDDAFFHPHENHPRASLRRVLTRKLEPLLKRSSACFCGNSYLRDYAAQFCPNSLIVPTVVDTDVYLPRPLSGGRPPVIGWIGSPTTWENVRPLLPLLRDLVSSRAARVRIVGAGAAAERDAFPGLELVDWSQASEVAEVQSFDIGIMPLLDLPFQRGKSGYKLVQYMACGVPVVASPIGVNSEIVDSGVNGFVATDDRQWSNSLRDLLANPELRLNLGMAGRKRAVAKYSLSATAPTVISTFRKVQGRDLQAACK